MIIHTFKSGWFKARKDEPVTARDTALAAATKGWSNRPTAKTVEIPIGANGIVVGFIGDALDAGDPDGDTFDYKVFVYAEDGGAEKVCIGTATIGKQQVISLPYGSDKGAAVSANNGKYADTFASVTDYWHSEVGYADSDGDDGLATLAFDAEGGSELFVEITSLTAQLSVIPIMRVY